jgi:hypothetical protein
MKKVKLDLPRRVEYRYLVPKSARFPGKNPLLERLRFSGKERVQNVYFGNSRASLPLKKTIKARRYLEGPSDPRILEMDSPFFLDVKEEDGSFKKKERFGEAALRKFGCLVSEHCAWLRPYFLSEYSRKHYSLKGEEGVRITVDDDIVYSFFPRGAETGIVLGREEGFVRVEVKMEGEDAGRMAAVGKVFGSTPHFRAISKKGVGLSLVSGHLESLSPLHLENEFPGAGIKSRMEASEDGVIEDARQLFAHGVGRFGILGGHRYMGQRALMRGYWVGGDGDCFETKRLHANTEVFFRGPALAVCDSRFLGCISKRWNGEPRILPIDAPLFAEFSLLGEFPGASKYFYVMNSKTLRAYRMSLTACQDGARTMGQLEVSYAGGQGQPQERRAAEDSVISDLEYLTEALLDLVNGPAPPVSRGLFRGINRPKPNSGWPRLKRTYSSKKEWMLKGRKKNGGGARKTLERASTGLPKTEAGRGYTTTAHLSTLPGPVDAGAAEIAEADTLVPEPRFEPNKKY